MTKLDKINWAYSGYNVSDIANENGWITVQIIGHGISNNMEYENFVFEIQDIDLTFGIDGAYIWRPKTLRGIDSNNGWNKINSESDLPAFESNYLVMDKSEGGTMIEYHFIKNDVGKRYWMRNFTHWILKPEIPKPMY